VGVPWQGGLKRQWGHQNAILVISVAISGDLQR